jgi:hypothetical protein
LNSPSKSADARLLRAKDADLPMSFAVFLIDNRLSDASKDSQEV